MTGLKDPDVSSENNITLQGVSFAYPSRRKVQVLDSVDMTFEARKTTAIVGPSGSGKSTIVGLIERWYDLDDYKIPAALRSTKAGVTLGGPRGRGGGGGPQRFERPETPPDKKAEKAEKTIELPDPPIGGKIYVGDVDLSTVDAVWWRQQIGLVQQEPVLFNDTIFTNVAYGLYGTQYDLLPDNEKLMMVEDACRQASADEFITKLPNGYMTMVGESGIKLSGGQRQRLAIARSIVKKPTILILDEATSAIDVRTERIVQEALDRVSANRTTIVIAHRLSTIKKADKIIVLRKGQVMEQGTHSQLLENDEGIYYGLVRAQAIAMTAEHETQDEEYDDNVVALDDERPELVKTKSNRSGLGPAQEHDGIMTKDGLVAGYKYVGFLRAFGTLLSEQKRFWLYYVVVIAACCAAGGEFYNLFCLAVFANIPLQPYIHSKPGSLRISSTHSHLQMSMNFPDKAIFGHSCSLYSQSACSPFISS
jgi:ATP-binding cassette subfamily B (MDR/TAP) protein 1